MFGHTKFEEREVCEHDSLPLKGLISIFTHLDWGKGLPISEKVQDTRKPFWKINARIRCRWWLITQWLFSRSRVAIWNKGEGRGWGRVEDRKLVKEHMHTHKVGAEEGRWGEITHRWLWEKAADWILVVKASILDQENTSEQEWRERTPHQQTQKENENDEKIHISSAKQNKKTEKSYSTVADQKHPNSYAITTGTM